jgi:hypothetical protein
MIVIDPNDNRSNQKNPNKGKAGTNQQYDHVHGNRGKQLNPNQKNAIVHGEDMDDGDVFWHDGCGD